MISSLKMYCLCTLLGGDGGHGRQNCKCVKYPAKDAACATRTHANLLFYMRGLQKEGTIHS